MTCGSGLNSEEEMNCVETMLHFWRGQEAWLKTSLSCLFLCSEDSTPRSFLQIAKHFQLNFQGGGCQSCFVDKDLLEITQLAGGGIGSSALSCWPQAPHCFQPDHVSPALRSPWGLDVLRGKLALQRGQRI